MVRQCAWCLRLINKAGERTSALPLTKIYEASHGICTDCGIIWLESVKDLNGDVIIVPPDGRQHQIQYLSFSS